MTIVIVLLAALCAVVSLIFGVVEIMYLLGNGRSRTSIRNGVCEVLAVSAFFIAAFTALGYHAMTSVIEPGWTNYVYLSLIVIVGLIANKTFSVVDGSVNRH